MTDTGLYIVATPIGNLGDISQRARDVLEKAEVIAAEDTRVTKKLLTLLGIFGKKVFIKYEDHSENEKYHEIIVLHQLVITMRNIFRACLVSHSVVSNSLRSHGLYCP